MAFDTIDRTTKQLVLTVQDYSLFAHRAVMNLFRPPRYWPEFLIQADIIGVGSASIVLLSGFFTGGVLALQSAATLLGASVSPAAVHSVSCALPTASVASLLALLAVLTLLIKSVVEWQFERDQKAAALLPPENPGR